MKKTIALVALLVMFCSSVAADGMIIPEPIPPHPHPTYLEIKYHHVNASINNQLTTTKVDQMFHNPNGWDIEGTYLFPLPQDASINKFSMYVDGEELRGEVLDRAEAKKIYEDLVRKLIDPGLLEYVDRNTFKARVYPIEARSDKRVLLDYSEVIGCDSGICEYVYPLDTERFTSKDIEGVVIRVEIESNTPINSIYSPSHEIEVRRINEYRAIVSYEANDVRPDTDFRLIYTTSTEDIGVNILTQKGGREGYYALMVSPGLKGGLDTINEKDIVFVLDKSGSMAGEKIEQAKEALKGILYNLNPKDRFGIVVFSTGVESYQDTLIEASEDNIDDAIEYVDKIKAIGGTDINSALLEGIEMIYSSDKLIHPKVKNIIFLTDGEPTVGVTDIKKIMDEVESIAPEDLRLFVFGVGYNVNTHLLDGLSLNHHGTSSYVTEEENIEVKVGNFYEKISNPVLSDISIRIEGVNTYDTYPKELQDLFKGSQLMTVGKYELAGKATIILEGRLGSEKRTFEYEVEFPLASNDNEYLPRLWATRKIGYLLEEIRLNGEDEELVDEIIKLSKEYGIATPYTSFLILEEEPSIGSRRLNEALAPQTGADAVEASQNIWGYKSAEAAPGSGTTGSGDSAVTVKYIRDKAFINKNGIFEDTGYLGTEDIFRLGYGSENYFQLLSKYPQLGEYFAIGKDLVVCFGDICISVREDYVGDEDSVADFELDFEEQKTPGCKNDSDCNLDCGCKCKIGGADCESTSCGLEHGILGCECEGSRCIPKIDPAWEPPQLPANDQKTDSTDGNDSAKDMATKQDGGGGSELLLLIGLVGILVIAMGAIKIKQKK